jgi:hypothetical protein
MERLQNHVKSLANVIVSLIAANATGHVLVC